MKNKTTNKEVIALTKEQLLHSQSLKPSDMIAIIRAKDRKAVIKVLSKLSH